MTLPPVGREESNRRTTTRMTAVQKVATTAGMVASLAVATPSADADLIVVDDRPLEVYGFETWDIDGDGGEEFFFLSRSSSASTYNNANFERFLFLSSVDYYGDALNGNLVVPQGLGNEIVALDDGFAINSMLPSAYQFGNANGFASRIISASLYQRMGPISNGSVIDQTSYLGNNLEVGINNIGFQFEIAGQTHYGWAEMEIGGFQSVTINRWVYESTPGESVTVGAIPEPNSLALLGLGAAGILSLRRRRTD